MRLVLHIALRQLWDRKLLNSTAIGGVMLGVAALVSMNAILKGFENKFKGEILRVSPHVTIYDKEVSQLPSILSTWASGPEAAAVAHELPSDRITRIKRPHELVAAIEQRPDVVAACLSLVDQAILSRSTKTRGIDMRGVVFDQQERCTPLASYVTQGSWRTLAAANDGIALGSGVSDEIGARVGDRVQLQAPNGQPISLRVLAVFDIGVPPIDKTRAYVSLATAQEVLRRPNVVGRVEIRLADPEQAPAVAARLEEATGNDVESWQKANANFLSLFDMQNLIVSMVLITLLAVGGFGILAIQIMIVLQKTRDIAILRSIGLRKRDVLWVFLLQGVAIALIGALVGDLVGHLVVESLSTWRVNQEGLVKTEYFIVYRDPLIYVYATGYAMFVGVLASLLPAWRASRVEPVEVLRGQIG